MSEERKSEVGWLVPLEVSWNAGCGIISGPDGGVASTPPRFLERRLWYIFQA